MPFNSSQAADNRLVADPARLTQEEVRDLIPWMRQISEAGMRRLGVELSLRNLEATQQFEQSSSKLTKWLVWLTAVLVVLTLVVAYYSAVLTQIAHRAK